MPLPVNLDNDSRTSRSIKSKSAINSICETPSMTLLFKGEMGAVPLPVNLDNGSRTSRSIKSKSAINSICGR